MNSPGRQPREPADKKRKAPEGRQMEPADSYIGTLAAKNRAAVCRPYTNIWIIGVGGVFPPAHD